MRRNNIFFLQQWPEQTVHVSGKQTFTSSSGFPPVSRSRTRLSPGFPEPQRNTDFLRPGLSSHKHTHTKGGIPNNRQYKKVEIDHRAAPQRTSPRPLSLSPFSSRRGHTAPWRVVGSGADRFLRWYPRALTPSSPQPAPPSLFCVQIDGRNGCGTEGGKEDAWLLVAWCCLDHRTYLIPPGFCGTVPIFPPLPHAGSSRLLCMASFSRCSSARCGEGWLGVREGAKRNEMEGNFQWNRRASDAGRRREAPGTRRLRRGFSVDARGCFKFMDMARCCAAGGITGWF